MGNTRPVEPRPAPTGECLLCTVGSLVRWKGHADLIAAFALALKRDDSLRLLIVGDGPERGSLERIARDLEVADRVTFAGFRAEVPAILRSADIYVHAALDEALGVAILEAMAAGKPVIATAVGGVLDIIPNATVGLLVPPADPAAMADAIHRLSADPGQREQMGRRGRQHVVDNFSIQAVVARYETLYETLAAGSHPGQARVHAHA
jgi:glycosyltransferase involved in cell wall biosynthesis